MQSCAESLIQIPVAIWDNVKNIPAMVWDFVKEIPGQVWGFFENAFSTVTGVVQNIFNSVVQIPDKILDGLKWLFVPNTENINSSIDKLVNNFKAAFGVNSYDISNLFGTETEVGDITGTINIGGFEFNTSFFDSSVFIKGVNTFRPAVRGFVVFLLILYNINQFLHFIGQQGLSLGSLIHLDNKVNGD